uniref:Uncharacterized protein n=1 Tax=Arundo donax TaxID=35708 RepID=A0A0A9BQ72_ARUDO
MAATSVVRSRDTAVRPFFLCCFRALGKAFLHAGRSAMAGALAKISAAHSSFSLLPALAAQRRSPPLPPPPPKVSSPVLLSAACLKTPPRPQLAQVAALGWQENGGPCSSGAPSGGRVKATTTGRCGTWQT